MNQNHENSQINSVELDFAGLDNINGLFRKNASINLYQKKKNKIKYQP